MSSLIPEDLQTWYSVACDEVHFATDHKVIKALIERIATLEAQNRQLREACTTALSAFAWLPKDEPPIRKRTSKVCDTLRSALEETQIKSLLDAGEGKNSV